MSIKSVRMISYILLLAITIMLSILVPIRQDTYVPPDEQDMAVALRLLETQLEIDGATGVISILERQQPAPRPAGGFASEVFAEEPENVNAQLRLIGVSNPRPGETAEGGIFPITATFRNIGQDSLPNVYFRVTSIEYNDGLNPPPDLINATRCGNGVGAQIDAILTGAVLSPGDTLETTFNILLPRINVFRFFVDAYTGPAVPCTEIIPFEEEVGSFKMPDLAVDSLSVEPEKADPGELVTLRAAVSNNRREGAGPASLVFLIDGEEVARVSIGSIGPFQGAEVAADWVAAGPGRHHVVAQIEFENDTFDRGLYNDSLAGMVYVSGEALPQPELVFDVDLDSLDLRAGEAGVLTLTVRNPSFAHVSDVPVDVYIDGELVQFGGDDLFVPGPVIDLAPDEEQVIEIPWSEATPGQHLVAIQMSLPEDFPDFAFQSIKAWQVSIPGVTSVCNLPPAQKDRWCSIGPSILYQGSLGMPSGSLGRMDRIAFHPTDPKTIYAAAPGGGIWKTTDGGDSWTPLGDRLPSPNVRAIAVDPQHPQVVYLATFSGYDDKGAKGFFKSADGGTTWYHFAPKEVAANAKEFAIRYPSPGQVMIYAATERGLLRYTSNDPLSIARTNVNDWVRIKSGDIVDMAVHPTDLSVVYASVSGGAPGDGVYRTRKGDTATPATEAGDWDMVTAGLPAGKLPTLDIYKGDPRMVYAAIQNPLGQCCGIEQLPFLGIYRSVDEGDSWGVLKFEHVGDNQYNGYIRVHPTNPNLVYFGGVKHYKDENAGSDTASLIEITGVHYDAKVLEFDPFDSSFYWNLNDGGVWRCKIVAGGNDSCVHRNRDLRTTQFFDFDASSSNQNLMLGGTQDNGTILYQGAPDWNFARGGDGNYSLIAPSDNEILYGQHQFLKDSWGTARCDKGVQCRDGDWTLANNGLPAGAPWKSYMDGGNRAYITVHPNNADYLLSQGDEVHFTDNGGQSWTKKGPKGANVHGQVTRVVIQPTTLTWIAGNSTGQIWYSTNGGVSWTLLFEHPCAASPTCSASVRSLAFAPTDHKVMYATFDVSANNAYTRIWRFEMNPGPPASWASSNITENFPDGFAAQVISGDGHNAGVAYVGTKSGVYRWMETEPTYNSWQPYNNGLPLTDVRDLLVDPTSKELRAATFGRGAWTVSTAP